MQAAMTLALIMTCAAAWAEDVQTYYIDENGMRHDVTATVLTGTGALTANQWYVVNSDVTINSNSGERISCGGNINLILADGKTFTISSNNIHGIIETSCSLNIYGQENGTGMLNVTATGTSGFAIYAYDDVNIVGGKVTANSDLGYGIYSGYGNITISGGQVSASGGNGNFGIVAPNNLTLGWRKTTDYVYVNSYYHSNIKVKDGLTFTDGTTTYSGTLDYNQINAINGKTLTPFFSNDFSVNAEGTEYTIHTATGWGVFCEYINDGESFNGKTVKLVADIGTTTNPIIRMASSEGHKFKGTFDGEGHTLTINYSGSDLYIAPFRVVSDYATFRDLTVAGTINSSAANAGGLIGELYGDITVEHCTSNVDITSTGGQVGGFIGLCKYKATFNDCLSSAVIHSSGVQNGGFVGYSWSAGDGTHAMSFTGCLFNGKLLQIDGKGSSNGGFIGWKGESQIVTITNCLVDPAALAEGETMANGSGATFARGWNDNATALNSYYITPFGAAQAKQTHSITAGENVTVANAGTATAYATSGITCYGTGVKYNDVLYAGNQDQVSLSLNHSDLTGYTFIGYTVDYGNLSGNDTDGYTLTMTDNDVTITAEYCAIPANFHIVGEIGKHSVTVDWDNELGETFEYALVLGHDIELTTVTYDGTTNASEMTWNNLNSDNDYTIVLRKQCSTDHYSQAIALEFHTAEACPAPTLALVDNSITSHGATVSWTGSSDSYTLQIVSAVSTETVTLVSEGFEGGTMPEGWSMVGNGTWKVGTGNYFEGSLNTAHTGSYNAKATHNNNGDKTYLLMPALDLSQAFSATISLWYSNEEWGNWTDRFGVYYRVDGGTWNELFYTSTSHATWTEIQNLALPNLAANYEIGFLFEDDWGNGVTVDDVVITAVVPQNQWTDIASNATSPYTFNNLEPETTYYVRVIGNCGDDGNSDPSNLVGFTTDVPCPAPTLALVDNSITSQGATMSWTGSSESYILEYAEGISPLTWNTVSSNASSPYTFDNLNPATTYSVRVTGNCGSEGNSLPSNVVSFTTDCVPVVVDALHPFFEDFAGADFPPSCWDAPTDASNSSCHWGLFHWHNHTENGFNCACSTPIINYGDVYLVMPDLQISNKGDAARLTFWSYYDYLSLHINGSNSTVVLLSGDTETELWALDFNGVQGNTWYETTIDLTAYMGQTISLAFKYEGNAGHTWYVDDVEVTVTASIFTKDIVGYGDNNNVKTGWYLIASPLDGSTLVTDVDNLTNETYDLYYFDQTGGNNGAEWKNHKAHPEFTSLVSGQGYLYANSEDVTLTFTGKPYSGESKVTLSKTNTHLGQWNLIGNPLGTNATLGDKPFYIMNESGTEIIAADNDHSVIAPMQGVFVQANEDGETVTFAAQTRSSESANEDLVLNLAQNGSTVIDRAIVRMGDGQTLPKFQIRENSSKLYITQGGKDYAIVSVGRDAARHVSTMDVNFKAKENGEYTITVNPEGVEMAYLHLIDNMMGMDVDLLTPNGRRKALRLYIHLHRQDNGL